MPNITGATNFFPKSYENTVPMTLGGSVLAGAATVPVNGMTNYTDGDVICFVVDGATPALKQVFTGTKSGANIINAVWTEFPTGGVNVPHSAGATVIDYVSATHWALMQKGITSSLNQDGSLKTAAVQAALNITGGAAGGWTPSGFTPSAVVNNGNRSYTLTFSANNLTTVLSPGMRLQLTRTVTAPTQCTSLNGTTQYWSKAAPAAMAQTDSITEMAWIKLTSYTQGGIVSRNNGTTDGWKFYVNASGQLVLAGARAADDLVTSLQSVPLNRWIHVAASINTVTPAASVYMDGVLVASTYTNNANTGFAAPTSSYLVGATNGAAPTDFFPGKIAQAASFNAVITQATILTYMSQGLAGTEASLISAYSFNGSANDLNANANNLTANNAATAVNADTPFTQTQTLTGYTNGATNFAIVQTVSFSVNTTCVVQVAEGDTIPTSGGVSAVSYATAKVPYAMLTQRGKWSVDSLYLVTSSQASPANGTWYNVGSMQLNVPIGEWMARYEAQVGNVSPGTSSGAMVTLSTANNTQSDPAFSSGVFGSPVNATTGNSIFGTVAKSKGLSVAAAAVYYLNAMVPFGGTTNVQMNTVNGVAGGILISAEPGYL